MLGCHPDCQQPLRQWVSATSRKATVCLELQSGTGTATRGSAGTQRSLSVEQLEQASAGAARVGTTLELRMLMAHDHRCCFLKSSANSPKYGPVNETPRNTCQLKRRWCFATLKDVCDCIHKIV